MMGRHMRFLAAAMVLGMALAACGGDDVDNTAVGDTDAQAAGADAEPAADADEADADGASGDGETFTIGLAWNEQDIALVQAWEDYLIELGEEWSADSGIDLEWVINVANNDPSRQASNIEDLINQDVDLIMARAEDGAAIGASITAADAAGIPFLTFDRASATTAATAHVGGDSTHQARSTGEAFGDILAENGVEGRCIELQGALTDENAVNRTEAFAEVDAERDEFEIITKVPTEWNPELFLSGATNALQANPDANCMIIASDFAFSAVQSALENAGRWAPTGEADHMWFATQDLFPPGYEAMSQGYIDVGTTYDAFAHAQEAIRVIGAIATGEEPGCADEGCLAEGRLATPENVETLENLWSRDYD